jgi:hypothetical protein
VSARYNKFLLGKRLSSGAFLAQDAKNRAIRSKSSDLLMQILWAFHFYPIARRPAAKKEKIHRKVENGQGRRWARAKTGKGEEAKKGRKRKLCTGTSSTFPASR